MDQKITSDFFIGEWQVCRPEYHTKYGTWEYERILHPMEAVGVFWKFTETKYFSRTDEEAEYKEGKNYEDDWGYYPDTNILLIDETSYYSDGHIDQVEGHHFIVEIINEDEALLYYIGLSPEKPESFDYRQRIIRFKNPSQLII